MNDPRHLEEILQIPSNDDISQVIPPIPPRIEGGLLTPINAWNEQNNISDMLDAHNDYIHLREGQYRYKDSTSEAGVPTAKISKDGKRANFYGSSDGLGGKSFDAFDFMKHTQGFSQTEAVKYAAKHTLVDLTDPNSFTVDQHHKQLRPNIIIDAKAAFAAAGVGSTADWMPNKSEFNNAIEHQHLASEHEIWPDGKTERGIPLPTTLNFEFMIKRKGVRLALNDMSHEIEVVGIRLQSDSVENDAINWVEDEAIRNRMPFSRIKSSISTIAAKNRYHPFDRHLDTLPEWDSDDRIGEFVRTLKTKDDSADYYNTSHMMITRWLISIVAAVRRPHGSNPLRIVLVLSGPQHIGKTTTYKKIMPDSSYFKDGGHLDPADKDSVIQNTQHLVVELGEIDTTFARKDVSRLKAFIGKDIDLIRLPYDKGVSKYVRRTVYCGTVNDSSFLTDQTGNSRFAVIDLVSIDWDKLNQINIKQLWAQILHLFNTGEPWNFTQDELTLVNNRNTQHTETPYIETLVKEKFNWNTDKGSWQWLTITEIVDQVHLQDVVVRNSRSRKEFISALTHQTESKMDSKRRTNVYLVPLSTAFLDLALRSHSLRGA
tara:strand:- start:5321 stop:7120 length:1800 start_codon:yes stop_codon:yes gene_type:complete